MTTVSVILASYNQAEYLDSGVKSVLEQTFDDWELVIVDNGSTDGSHALLEKYQGHPKIRVVLHHTNEAPTKRLNQAIALAQGEYVSIVYSDDYYLPDKLSTQVAEIRRLSPEWGVVYSPGYRLDVDTGAQKLDPTITSSGWVLDDLLSGLGRAFINPISPLIRRECLVRYPFYEDLFIEGESIFFRIAMTYKFAFLPAPTVIMRDHARNVGRSLKKNIVNILACLDRLATHPELPVASARVLHDSRSRFLRNAAWMVLRVASDREWSRSMFFRGARADWRQVVHPKTVLGLPMTLLPSPVLRRLNAAIFRLRRVDYRTDYVE
jgi:glycosyltransferase involved in cell wall biosynthesis